MGRFCSLTTSSAVAAVILVGLLVRPTSAVPITFDPAVAGLAGAAFAFDALQGVELARIDNTPGAGVGGSTIGVTQGFLQVTGVERGGVSFVPPGLNTTYSLYFSISTTIETPGLSNVPTPGRVISAVPILFGANGVSSFGFTASLPTVDNNGNVPVQLLSVGFIDGTPGARLVSPNPLALDLTLTLNGLVNPIAPGFLVGSEQPLLAHFVSEALSSHVTILDGGATFLIRGGADTVTFSVPEPASFMLLGIALAGLTFARRNAWAGCG